MMNQRGMNFPGMGDAGAMYRGGGGGQFMEPSNEVLRLDSSGNFHPDYGSRGRHFDTRDDRSRSSSYKGRSDRRWILSQVRVMLLIARVHSLVDVCGYLGICQLLSHHMLRPLVTVTNLRRVSAKAKVYAGHEWSLSS